MVGPERRWVRVGAIREAVASGESFNDGGDGRQQLRGHHWEQVVLYVAVDAAAEPREEGAARGHVVRRRELVDEEVARRRERGGGG